MAYRQFYIDHEKQQHGPPPLHPRLYCHLFEISIAHDPNDRTWRLAVHPPATMGMAQHYWNVVKTLFYPDHQFHATHPKPPAIFAEFNRNPKQFVDNVKYVSLDFAEFEYTADSLVIYPVLLIANEGNNIHVVNQADDE
ncbi:hypothetical protein C8J56DRAFT_1067864 [Mycena floridula]|nr:hypothetical protein C8J56DRAFT_1067864 [Mycena floridula]